MVLGFCSFNVSRQYRSKQLHSPHRQTYTSRFFIHLFSLDTLTDMGGIYTLGWSNNTVIFQNKIEQVNTFMQSLGIGIYLDQGSAYMVICCSSIINMR